MTFKKQVLPEYFIISFCDHFESLREDFNFFESFGIDGGLFFDEVISLVYNNYGETPTAGDFDDMDYIWISPAYDTYCMLSANDPEPEDIESFYLLYSSIVEKIFLCIYKDIEHIMERYGPCCTFNIHFVSFLRK